MKTLAKFAALAAVSMIALNATHASAEETITEFRIGILGGENEADRLRSNECLVKRYEALLGVPVKLFPAADYAGTIEGLKGGNLDYAELGASGYAALYLEDENLVEPLATTEQTDGSTGYHSVLITLADSNIDNLDEMKGKVLGYADPNSTSGYLIPYVSFKKQGIDPDAYFAKTVFSGGHEQNVLAVLNHDVDAGVTWASGVGEWEEGYSSGNLRKMVDKGMLDMSQVREIWKSPLIPNGPTVVRSSLPQGVKDKLKASLLSFNQDDPECMYKVAAGEINRYVEVQPSFYEPIFDARRATIEAKKN
ncbi:phosphonate ABC transporter substrate-binding protein [Roseibium aestuarii]|uniref:Phosphonate ABC transporter substrate-binding protein n=1 Tax=Roseibium aestuarii TaxID=2600299 RepID=A0ABW4JTV7_9HYPH|nr:phosphonate ABC transporter substrate-binding protein [Roseibium aestuarii]